MSVTDEIPASPEQTVEEIIVEEKPKRKTTVKVKVLVGSLRCELGTFQKGAVFETTRKRAALFNKNDVAIL